MKTFAEFIKEKIFGKPIKLKSKYAVNCVNPKFYEKIKITENLPR